MRKIIYLDYSATTKPDEKVLDYFNEIVTNYWNNSNSNYYLAKEAKKIVDSSIKNIENYFNSDNHEVIFTSGASEANNLAIKGITNNSRKQIITTELEHSSIFGPIGYLQKQGYEIKFVNLTKDGLVDIKHLESLINDETLLVTIGAVDSEIGIRQPIEEIGELLKQHPNVYFHSDITQVVGKDQVDINNIDLASFSGHKIYGFKGIGGLIKKKAIKLTPLIHGGKSTTVYRSGTPSTELIGSLSESFNLFKDSLEDKYQYVKKLNNQLRDELVKLSNVYINSNEYALPHILNVSIVGFNSNDTQKYFEKHHIFISTKTACASNTHLSKSVLALTNDEGRAESSVRISISYKTTEEEINQFIKVLKEYLKENN